MCDDLNKTKGLFLNIIKNDGFLAGTALLGVGRAPWILCQVHGCALSGLQFFNKPSFNNFIKESLN